MAIKFPIPRGILEFGLRSVPVFVGIVGAFMHFSDYVLSGSFLRATNVMSSYDTFDFIVVGAGTAGSVTASRLSEDPNIKVLLIEANGDPNPFTYIPGILPGLLNHPALDWEYKTVPQNGTCFGLKNQQVKWPRGKGLGGSTNLNFMIYMRGNNLDFDRWEAHTGDSRWSSGNFENYFQKIEDYHGFWEGNGYHRKGGPLRVEKLGYALGLNYVLDAATELGYEVRDHNKMDQREGFSPIEFTQKHGIRFSAYSAYIKPSEFRSNLVIYRYTLATKIHFNEDRRAIGVSYLKHGVHGFAAATQEIIVSGGVINSPQLLMLSGIGPREHLIQHGIPPIADLPVGLNLQDHVSVVVGPFLLNQSESFIVTRDIDFGAVLKYLKSGTGPLSSPLALTAVGLVSSSLAQSPNWPDIMLSFGNVGIDAPLAESLNELFNARDNSLATYLSQFIGTDSNFVVVTVCHPKSRGYIRLRNANPTSPPLINPQYFSDPANYDLQVLVEGMEIAANIYENTSSFRRLNARFPTVPYPFCEHAVSSRRAQFECIAKAFTQTAFHPSGTCSMGAPRRLAEFKLPVKNCQPKTARLAKSQPSNSQLRIVPDYLRCQKLADSPKKLNPNTKSPC